jgi:hypothetical protein
VHFNNIQPPYLYLFQIRKTRDQEKTKKKRRKKKEKKKKEEEEEECIIQRPRDLQA